MRDHMTQPAVSGVTACSIMPVDKQKSGIPTKPVTPTLSTTFRNPKSPLTPRLAEAKNASPLSPAGRGLRSESTLPPATSQKDGFRSPTPAKLNGNVTPRSGARVSRIGGASPSTPASSHTGTPLRTRPLSAVELSRPRRYNGTGAGLGTEKPKPKQGTPLGATNTARGSVMSGGLGRRLSTGSPRNRAADSMSAKTPYTSDSKFSFDSEPQEAATTAKHAAFFYASDAARRTKSPERLPITPPPPLEEDLQGKFCYANTKLTDQMSTDKKPAAATNGAPAATSPPSPPSPPSQPIDSQGVLQVLQESSSPTKAASLRSAPATLSSSSANSIRSGTTDAIAKSRTSITPSETNRRASTSSKTSTVRQTAHRKLSIAQSAPSTPPKRAELQISPRAYKSQYEPQTGAPASPTERFSPRSTSLSSSNTAVSTQTLDSTPCNSLHLLSPIKTDSPQSSQLQRTNELAANARRERKVLDLEISNSSLLAINRTLEREMRRQSLELRRFRRLSRSSQMPMVCNSARSISGQSMLSTVTEFEHTNGTHESLSDPRADTTGSEIDESDLESSFGDESSLLSSTPDTEQDNTSRRLREEKRLMLDLNKHRQLLVDSQKLNHSIKRCIGWTEELINEGKKALDYQVKVSDVDVRGKLPAPVVDEEEYDGGDGGGRGGGFSPKGLLSAGLAVPIPAAVVERGRRLWRQGLEEIEMEVDRMLESSTTLKEDIPA